MNMRRGRRPTIDRLRALCDVLGLEFYVGWPRTVPGADLDVERLALALETVAAEFPRAETRLSVPDRAQLLVAVYGVLIENDPLAAAARARELIAIARRFGVPRRRGDDDHAPEAVRLPARYADGYDP